MGLKDEFEKKKEDDKIELSLEEELILEKNLVWIFSSPRSGSTWLAKQLLSHNTITMNEPLFGLHFAIARTYREVNSKLPEFRKQRDDYFFSNKYEYLWKHWVKKIILNRIYGQFENLTNKIIIKEPTGSYGSEMIAKCLPNSKMITVLRDGRDVLDSFLDARSKGGWSAQIIYKEISGEKRISELKKMAKNWVAQMKIILNAYNNHSSNLRYLVRYEDLRTNTVMELHKIYKFLEIPITEEEISEIVTKSSFENIPNELKGKGKHFRSATPGKWKENLLEEEIDIIQPIMKDRLAELGYE